MSWLRSLLFVLAFYPGSALFVIAGTLLGPLSRPLLFRIVRGWVDFHYLCARLLLGIRTEIEGEFPTGPVLIAVKHESMFETVELPRHVALPAIPAKQELFDIPLFGGLMREYGNIPVARHEGARAMRAMIAAARAVIAEGRPIVIFPEGSRVPHGTMPPLKPGVMGLYRLLNLPLVPVAVDSGRLWPRGKFLKRPGVIRFRVGETIPAGLSRAEANERTHRAINALNEK